MNPQEVVGKACEQRDATLIEWIRKDHLHISSYTTESTQLSGARTFQPVMTKYFVKVAGPKEAVGSSTQPLPNENVPMWSSVAWVATGIVWW